MYLYLHSCFRLLIGIFNLVYGIQDCLNVYMYHSITVCVQIYLLTGFSLLSSSILILLHCHLNIVVPDLQSFQGRRGCRSWSLLLFFPFNKYIKQVSNALQTDNCFILLCSFCQQHLAVSSYLILPSSQVFMQNSTFTSLNRIANLIYSSMQKFKPFLVYN